MIYGTNYNKFFGRFEEIGLLHVKPVFHWLYNFGLDVPSGMDVRIIKTLLIHGIKLIFKFTNFMEDYKTIFYVRVSLSFFGSMNNYLIAEI